MSASAPSLGKMFRPVPPKNGSFPLDHAGDCAELATKYLACLKLVDGVNAPNCRTVAKNYLECRMVNELMDRDEWENLGFHKDDGTT